MFVKKDMHWLIELTSRERQLLTDLLHEVRDVSEKYQCGPEWERFRQDLLSHIQNA